MTHSAARPRVWQKAWWLEHGTRIDQPAPKAVEHSAPGGGHVQFGWQEPDSFIELGKREVEQVGLARYEDVEDGCVFRVPKAYPIYDSNYRDCLVPIRRFLDSLENFQTIGRNGLHRYNNQEHAMLTGMLSLPTGP